MIQLVIMFYSMKRVSQSVQTMTLCLFVTMDAPRRHHMWWSDSRNNIKLGLSPFEATRCKMCLFRAQPNMLKPLLVAAETQPCVSTSSSLHFPLLLQQLDYRCSTGRKNQLDWAIVWKEDFEWLKKRLLIQLLPAVTLGMPGWQLHVTHTSLGIFMISAVPSLEGFPEEEQDREPQQKVPSEYVECLGVCPPGLTPYIYSSWLSVYPHRHWFCCCLNQFGLNLMVPIRRAADDLPLNRITCYCRGTCGPFRRGSG